MQRSSVELHGPANQGCARDDLQYLLASGQVTAQEGAEGKRLEGWSIVRTGGEKGARTNLTRLSSAHSRGGGRRVAPPSPAVAKQPAPEVASPGRALRAGGRWRREDARSRRSRRGGPRGPGPRVRGTYRYGGPERGGGREARGRATGYLT